MVVLPQDEFFALTEFQIESAIVNFFDAFTLSRLQFLGGKLLWTYRLNV
jgi:hypothetical protein